MPGRAGHRGLPTDVVADRAEAGAADTRSESTGRVANSLMAAVVVGHTVIALVSSLIVATDARRDEFALQRLIGSTRGQAR
ncbi:hypothetical protein [Streptomyces sp. AA1529]|uniref:hypothetical protein n=1 Tax=Streptomyces sp. AA1529 TaxID=1203257 RepID=UPI0002D581BC|nr:hypothetical protein [Streptomyces sp. AA1529]